MHDNHYYKDRTNPIFGALLVLHPEKISALKVSSKVNQHCALQGMHWNAHGHLHSTAMSLGDLQTVWRATQRKTCKIAVERLVNVMIAELLFLDNFIA